MVHEPLVVTDLCLLINHNFKTAEIRSKSTEMAVCAVQGCNKTLFKDGKNTLFFK